MSAGDSQLSAGRKKLTDVLVVLSALIINRWEKGPIYQSGEKLIDTGFDFIAVTCCLDASQLFFLFRFQGKVFDSTDTPRKSFFRAFSPRHEQRDICLPTHTRRHKIPYVADCCPVTSPLWQHPQPLQTEVLMSLAWSLCLRISKQCLKQLSIYYRVRCRKHDVQLCHFVSSFLSFLWGT